jgi:hypothetical protein
MAPDDLTKETAGTARAWVARSAMEVRGIAHSWLAVPELHALIDAVGGLDASLASDREALRGWSSTHLDTRGHAERRDAPAATIPVSVRTPLIDAAHALGLLATSDASASYYQAIIVLGGATTGNALRTELAARVAQKTAGWTLVGLTSDRALTAAEHQSDPDSRGDHVEWANLLRQIRTYIGSLSQETEKGVGGELGFTTVDRQKVRILIAPRQSHGRRPTTAQQLNFFCRRTPATDRHSVLLITNAIYAPYQFFAGATVLLENGSQQVELIGTRTTVDTTRDLIYQRIAQEIHSAILAATDIITADHGHNDT